MAETTKWDALRFLAADESINARRPAPGRRVRIVAGRKHLGAEGVVLKHFVGPYDASKWYYGDSMSQHLREICGLYGFTVKVREDDGKEFFVPAEYTCVL